MTASRIIDTDYYVISDDFRLLDFNSNVAERYTGVKVGDLCYQATMKRNSPCPHCPIAGNSQSACPVYYDPFYMDWVEAIFAEIGEGKYAVTCRPANDDAVSIFKGLRLDDFNISNTILDEYNTDIIGMIGGYCEEGFPLYYVNEKMVELMGYNSIDDLKEGIDEKVVNTIHPDDLPQVTADLGDEYYPGMKYETTYRMPRKDGSWFWTVDRGQVVETEDGRLAIISACLDITKAHERAETKAQLEIARAASEAKSAFLFNMSHDIRTPMNAIIGYTELLKNNLNDRQLSEDYIGKIKIASEFLLSLLNNVLELSKIESGKALLDESAVNLSSFSDVVHSMIASDIDAKNLTLNVNLNVQHATILADATKLKEVYLNVLSNAVKYTPSGGLINVEVTELPSEITGYAEYRVVIEDTGIGISKEFLPHIFDEFSREQNSTDSRIAGTGLGMPIVKKLIELMHGSIEVESSLGHGTRVTITVAHRIAPEQTITRTSADGNYDYLSTFAGIRILLAEDNDLNAEIAQTILEDSGLKVERASDGIICVDMITKAPPGYYNLVMMDIQMPNMDGYKAAQVIRRLPDEDKSNIPIIAMTANAFEEDRQKAFSVGMNAHVSKPIRVDILKSTIESILSGSHRECEKKSVN